MLVGYDISPEEANLLLSIAARNGLAAAASSAITNGADTVGAKWHGLSPLHIAAAFGHRNVLDVLLQSGVSPDLQQQDTGFTPLHLAAMGGHKDTVKALLKHEASFNLTDKYGMRAMDHAANNGHQDVMDELIAQGDDPNVRAQGSNALERMQRTLRRNQSPKQGERNR